MDFILHQVVCVLLVALSVERLFHMCYGIDPVIDLVGWFFVGVGAFAQLAWSFDSRPGFADVFVLIGAGLLLLLHAHPSLRSVCANRRSKDRRVV